MSELASFRIGLVPNGTNLGLCKISLRNQILRGHGLVTFAVNFIKFGGNSDILDTNGQT